MLIELGINTLALSDRHPTYHESTTDRISGYGVDEYDNADVMMEYDSVNVLLSDEKECRIRGTGKVQVHMRDGSSFVLDNVGNVLDSCNQGSTQQCMKSEVTRHLGVVGTQKQNRLVKETHMTLLAKLINESQVLLRVPRKNNMYSVDLKNIVPKRGLTCLLTKASSDESKLWHRRLGHLNFKTINNLVKINLVGGLPSKLFENDQTCVACQKGKQHRASCKSKTENSNSLPLYLLHMDLFGPTFVKSLMKKMYCLVVIDDFSRFTWVFFLATKDETSDILKTFITEIENLVDHKVKVIRCDNGTEFKNKEMNQFCKMKGILRQYSVARTPKQTGVAKRRNRTLIEAARTMLADSKLPTTFWAKAVNTAC
ncbi:putative ribonuclease H-like domain-containing protein [Tanacetum coccineum]